MTICAATIHADKRLVPQVLVLERELLSDERQHRRVGKVEHNRANGEDYQRSAGQKHAQAGRTFVTRLAIVEPASEVMINSALWYREHADDAGYRHRCEQEKYDFGPPKISKSTSRSGSTGVAGVIETLIAANPLGEGSMSHDTKRDSRERWTKHHAYRVGARLRNGDRPKR